MFRVGQKVVCVDASSPPIRGTQRDLKRYLVKGGIYTIDALRLDPLTLLPAVHLEEAPDFWWWFQAKRFRPIVERKTNISIFEAILKGAKIKEDA